MSFARDLAQLWRSSGFRKLATTRLFSQAGDGMFQFGIATAFFFSPEEAATPAQIAQGFVVLLAPFTLVGPFVGPLIDRWPRQRIIMYGNLTRLVFVAGIATTLANHGPLWLLYALALATLSINRFLLASMTAGLPKVVARDELLVANSTLPTLGTVAAILGGLIGAVVTFVVPTATDIDQSFAALTGAVVMMGLSSATATRLKKKQLGPEVPLEAFSFWLQVRELGVELAEGFAYLRARVTPLHALAVMATQRFLYGLMFVASILMSRHVWGEAQTSDEAVKNFGTVLLFAGAGFGLAAVVTPWLGQRIERHRWIVICLCVGAAGQALLAVNSERWALLTSAVVISFAVQGGKIAVDTIVQRDTQDSVRGRAFTLYDMAFNVAFISAAVVGALVLPDTGYSRWVMGTLAIVYVLVAVIYSRAPRVPRPLEGTAKSEPATT
jgi:MFS family permease